MLREGPGSSPRFGLTGLPLRRDAAKEISVSVTAQQVRDALGKVQSPRGAPLPEAGVLSDIVVNDGKVFFSIKSMRPRRRPGRTCANRRMRRCGRVPGVTSSMIALTAERKPGGAAPSARPQARQGVPPVSAHRAPQARTDRRWGSRRRLPASARSSRSPRARAASASRPRRSTSRWACAISACGSACWMRTSTGRRCRS